MKYLVGIMMLLTFPAKLSRSLTPSGVVVVHLGKLQFSGFPAWFIWLFIHIFSLIGFKNRIGVFMDWPWHYVTFKRGARLI